MAKVEDRIRSRQSKIGSQRTPVQERARQRRDDILRTTATLLDKVGFDDLTTVLIAREQGISVGSLYHYFPNKQAILHALGEQWLTAYSQAVADIGELELESMSRPDYCTQMLARLRQVYDEQRGLLPLIQAMYAVPELRDLDETHDEQTITTLGQQFYRLGIKARKQELHRIGRAWLELTHALLLELADQNGTSAQRTMADLNALCNTLLQRYQPCTAEQQQVKKIPA